VTAVESFRKVFRGREVTSAQVAERLSITPQFARILLDRHGAKPIAKRLTGDRGRPAYVWRVP